jgi:hypothetical protein
VELVAPIASRLKLVPQSYVTTAAPLPASITSSRSAC